MRQGFESRLSLKERGVKFLIYDKEELENERENNFRLNIILWEFGKITRQHQRPRNGWERAWI